MSELEDNVSAISPSSGNEDEACDHLCNDLMTSSYTEISFDASDDETDIELAEEVYDDNCAQHERDPSLVSHDKERQWSQKLSQSLSLPQLSSTIVNWSETTKASYESDVNIVPPFVAYDANMVSYVTHDFEKQLKLSASSSSIEGHTSRQSEIDLKVLDNLENQSKLLSNNINAMLSHISESTHNITSLTVECISTYETCLSKTCDAIDSNIKSMYQLMAKCEELNQSMKPINKLTDELKEVKRLLELFEKAVDYRM